MGIIELIVLSVGLAMDAFAVAVCKGLSMTKMKWKNACVVGMYFGGFQALMPLIGYLLGISFQNQIVNIDHWIAFILLVAIGINMPTIHAFFHFIFVIDKPLQTATAKASIANPILKTISSTIPTFISSQS